MKDYIYTKDTLEKLQEERFGFKTIIEPNDIYQEKYPVDNLTDEERMLLQRKYQQNYGCNSNSFSTLFRRTQLSEWEMNEIYGILSEAVPNFVDNREDILLGQSVKTRIGFINHVDGLRTHSFDILVDDVEGVFKHLKNNKQKVLKKYTDYSDYQLNIIKNRLEIILYKKDYLDRLGFNYKEKLSTFLYAYNYFNKEATNMMLPIGLDTNLEPVVFEFNGNNYLTLRDGFRKDKEQIIENLITYNNEGDFSVLYYSDKGNLVSRKLLDKYEEDRRLILLESDFTYLENYLESTEGLDKKQVIVWNMDDRNTNRYKQLQKLQTYLSRNSNLGLVLVYDNTQYMDEEYIFDTYHTEDNMYITRLKDTIRKEIHLWVGINPRNHSIKLLDLEKEDK